MTVSEIIPTLSPFTPPQGMYIANQIYTARQTLYLTASGGTTNPNHNLP